MNVKTVPWLLYSQVFCSLTERQLDTHSHRCVFVNVSMWACVCVCVHMTWCIRAWANIDVYWCIHYSDADVDVDTNTIGTFAPFLSLSRSCGCARLALAAIIFAFNGISKMEGSVGALSFECQHNSEYEKKLEDKTGRLVAVWWYKPVYKTLIYMRIYTHTHNHPHYARLYRDFHQFWALSKNEDN